MRIAYLAQLEADVENGINKKIVDQAATWLRLGHEVRIFILARSGGLWDGWRGVPVSAIAYERSQWRALRASRELSKEVRRWEPDIIYYRLGVAYPPFLALMASLPSVVEVNTDDESEARLRLGMVRHHVYRWAGRAALRAADGIVCVSRSVGEQLRRQGHDVLVLGNGIDMERFRIAPAPSNESPRLIFLGSSGCVWHGVDKLSALATAYPRWRFDIIGLERAEVGNLPENVVCHGFLREAAYRAVLEQADTALGTLALHRKNMSETSSLKVREYLAAGVPVISGHPDPDFPTQVPFVLELPNTPDNISSNLEAIASFVMQWKGRRVPREAVSRLDSAEKEASRLAFFETKRRAC